MNITTKFVNPPVPNASHWQAIDTDSYDAEYTSTGGWIGGPVGCGATREEAVKDLMEQMEGEGGDQ